MKNKTILFYVKCVLVLEAILNVCLRYTFIVNHYTTQVVRTLDLQLSFMGLVPGHDTAWLPYIVADMQHFTAAFVFSAVMLYCLLLLMMIASDNTSITSSLQL